MTPASRARLSRKLELQATARHQSIRESLRESAVSTKCALLEPAIRSYGSPRTRRKRDVEEDHVIALLSMSPYPVSKLDLLSDFEDIHTNVPLTSSTALLANNVHRGDSARRTQEKGLWSTSIRAQRETNRNDDANLHFTAEEINQREQKELEHELNQTPQAPEQRRIQYSTYTQSLIERTHAKLYDTPKYISMAKRAMGIEDGARTNKVLAHVSRIEESKHSSSSSSSSFSTSMGGLSVGDLNQHDGAERFADNNTHTPYLTNNYSQQQQQQRTSFSNGHDYFATERELPLLEDVDDDASDIFDRQHRWTKGMPAVYVGGATISTDGAFGRRDEPRVQGEGKLHMSTHTDPTHTVDASQYRQRATWLTQQVHGNSAPVSPGIVHLHKKPHLRPGAPSLDGHERLQAYSDSGGGMGSRAVEQKEGQHNEWEVQSRAHALTFHDSINSPRKNADASKRIVYLHQTNRNGLSMSLL